MLALKRGRTTVRARGMRRLSTPLIVAVLAAAVLTACGGGDGSTSSSSDKLTIALPGTTPESFDLATTCSSATLWLAYEPLIRISSTGTYEPGIAESWKYSENNTVFTLKIRKGIKFADGTDVTAKSVVDTLNYYSCVRGLNDGFIKPLTIEP